MTPEEFNSFCSIGREQKELTWPEKMLPMLALVTDDGLQLVGLVGDSGSWPDGLLSLGREKKPKGAVLTSDTVLRMFGADRTPQPAQDALLVLDSDGRTRAMPYSMEHGKFVWHEAHDATPSTDPIRDALKAMVRQED